MDTIATQISTTPPSATVGIDHDGFFVDTYPLTDDTFHMRPDKRNLMIGFVLGLVTFTLLVIGLVFAVKLYRRKLKKTMEKERYMEELEEGNHWMMAEDSTTVERKVSIGASNGSRKSHLSSLLNPGSQFSLAVQRASEIPNSPTT